ncbi:trigger factor, partial [Candidatus Aerophobetes bacterium]|nr:trigger factor [Candidatus Aerophobetes bacterium]
GKVPRKIFEHRFGQEVLQKEAIKRLYPEVYQEVVVQQNLSPIIEPTLEILQFSPNKPLILRIDLVTKPEVKLGKYKGIKVKEREIETSKDEITRALGQLQEQYADYPPVKEKRGVRDNDWVTLDWQVFYKGKLLARGVEKNFTFQIGSLVFPPSFSQGLIGLKTGEKRSLEIQFPLNYPRKDFAGREITFEVTLKQIREKRVPPIDGKFVKNLKFNSLKSLRKHIKENIAKTKKNWEEKRLSSETVRKVVEDSKVDLPLSLVEGKVDERRSQLENRLKERETTLEDYIKDQKLSEKELQEKLKSEVEKDLKTYFVLEAIAEQDKIEVREEEIEERLKSLVRGKVEEKDIIRLKNSLAASGELKILTAELRNEKVVDFLYHQARIERKQKS